VSLLDDSVVAPLAGGSAAPDALFEEVDPEWSGKVGVLEAQRKIAGATIAKKRVTGPPDRERASEPQAKSVALVAKDAEQVWRSSPPARRRRRRRARRRRPEIERTRLVGRIVALADNVVGVVIDTENQQAVEDEYPMELRRRDLPPTVQHGLQVGDVFQLTIDQWIDRRGAVMSRSEFELREAREFTDHERERIERRAEELLEVLGEPPTDPIL
jgi:hypothetical protein